MTSKVLINAGKCDTACTDVKQPRRQTILIVDDNIMNRELGKAILATENLNIITAENGAQALACVVKAPPDLILLDMLMPGMNGLEVLRKLKSDAAMAKISVIIMTGLADQESATQALDAGADEYLSKPVDPDELILRVKKILRACK